jgi:signal transduction histidine kinase
VVTQQAMATMVERLYSRQVLRDLYIGVVVAVAAGLFAFAASHPTAEPWDVFGAAGLFAAMVVSERLSVRLSTDSSVSIAAIPHLVSVLLLPPWLTMALAGGAMVADQVSARTGSRKLLFNTASIMLTVGLTAFVADAVGLGRGDLASGGSWQQVPAFVVVAATYHISVYLVVAVAVSLSSGQPLAGIFLDNVRFALPAEIAMCGVGGLVAVLWVLSPAWAPLVLFPGLLAQLALNYVASSKRSSTRLALIAEASRLLDLSFEDEQQLAPSLARLAVPTVADICMVYLPSEDGSVHCAALAHADRVNPTSDTSTVLTEWVGRVLAQGQPAIVSGFRPPHHAQAGLDVHQLRRLARSGVESLIAVPLVARERALGVLVFVSSVSGRRYGAADLAMAEELGRRCAVSMDNAHLHAQAQEATRLRDEFLSVAAHELKTPMTSLRGYAQLLGQGISAGDVIDAKLLAKGLRVIDTQAEKLAQLTAQLLDVSRIEAGKLQLEPRQVDMADLVRGLAASAQAGTREHVLRAELPARCPALVDPLRIEQVVTNLLSNAIKYSPHGGDIEVVLDATGTDTIRLQVRDHGIGIPPERRGRLFDRFYQAHGEGHFGGLGLGLFISRQIVELHGGSLEADFPADGGTRFTVTLPRQAAVTAAA